jgi:two-component system chemotaxis response regulator CheY
MQALILDDSRAMRQILKRIIAPLGFDVIESANGVEGLAKVKEFPGIELALVDWNMPEMNGIDFVRSIRCDLKNKKMKLVMITTESDPAKVARALMLGVDEFIIKPFAFEELLQKLQLIGVTIPAMV